jgi:hypothetical protein
MSPEQAKGQVVDRTSDVWAFGCVLYEMLTGTRVFEGQSVADVLAAVIRQDPNWDRLPAGTPASIRRLLRRCLQKDHKRRLQWIGDARLEIADATDSSDADTAEGAANRSSHARVAWIGFAIAVLIAVLLGLWSIRSLSPSPPRELRVDIAVSDSSDKTSLAISPDGLKIAYVADSNGSGLWLRSLESAQPRKLQGTENAAFPFWSTDSRSVGFMAGGKLKRIDISSGLVRTITDAAGRGGTWNKDGIIVYAPGVNTSLFKISENGEEKPVPVTRLKGQQGTHRQPWFLPDGHHFLFWGQDGGVETRAIYVGDLDNSEPRRILNRTWPPSMRWASCFLSGSSVFAQPFDADHLHFKELPPGSRECGINPGPQHCSDVGFCDRVRRLSCGESGRTPTRMVRSRRKGNPANRNGRQKRANRCLTFAGRPQRCGKPHRRWEYRCVACGYGAGRAPSLHFGRLA